MPKPLNVGLIGYGFMGRTHSNAYRKAPNFFDMERQRFFAQDVLPRLGCLQPDMSFFG